MIVAVAAIVAAALVAAAWQQAPAVDAAEQERRDAGADISSADFSGPPVQAQLEALIHRCRKAVVVDVWPDKAGRFDGGREPEGAVMFMSPRRDGMPVIEFDRTLPTAAGFFPVTAPVRGRVGVRGRFEHEHWYGGRSAADVYFCDIDVAGMRFDVRAVSIEIVR